MRENTWQQNTLPKFQDILYNEHITVESGVKTKFVCLQEYKRAWSDDIWWRSNGTIKQQEKKNNKNQMEEKNLVKYIYCIYCKRSHILNILRINLSSGRKKKKKKENIFHGKIVKNPLENIQRYVGKLLKSYKFII